MCTSPLDGQFGDRNPETGKRPVVFRRGESNDSLVNNWVTVPCGRCMECRLRKKREYALRCQHEVDMHAENSWFSLTYDDEHLPKYGSLCKKDLSGFLKRLRARKGVRPFKFFACGEYGGRFDRPHYHVLLFGFDFPDKVRGPERNGYRTWNSELLESTWKKGFAEVGEVNFDGMAYIAKYVTKRNREDEESMRHVLCLEPEFLHMSRGGRKGHGVGYEWWQQYGEELLAHDSVILKGQEVAVPRYYDGLNEDTEPEEVKEIKARRKARCSYDEERSTRLLARQKIVESGAALFNGG